MVILSHTTAYNEMKKIKYHTRKNNTNELAKPLADVCVNANNI